MHLWKAIGSKKSSLEDSNVPWEALILKPEIQVFFCVFYKTPMEFSPLQSILACIYSAQEDILREILGKELPIRYRNTS